MSRLQHVTVKRFKSITDLTLSLDRINILVGTNNAGKSSVLQAIQFGVSSVQSLALTSTRNLRGVQTGTLSADQLVYTPLRDVQTLAHGGRLSQNPETAIEITFVRDGESLSISVRRGKNSNLNVALNGDIDLVRDLESMDTPFSAISPGLAGIPSIEEYRAPAIARRAAAYGDANSVFRNVLLILKQDPVGWQQFEERMRRIFPDVEIDVAFDPQRDSNISAHVTRSGTQLPIDAAGTGILQAAQILAYIGVYRPKLLILDEPDSHLHPHNQRGLIQLLDEVTLEADFQVLLSTHSRHLLDEANKIGAALHWIDDGQLRAGNTQRLPMLLSLGALDVGDRLQDGAIDTVVLTEDHRPRFIKAILESNGFDLSTTTVWSYDGCTNLPAAKVLAGFIADIAPGCRLLIHRDRDYLSEEQCLEIRNKYRKSGFKLFFTGGTDIESHFLTVEHLRHIYPSRKDAEIVEALDHATAATSQDSIRIMANERFREAELSWQPSNGRRPEAGNITTATEAEYRADPERFRHGKKTLREFNKFAEAEWGAAADIAVATTALAIPELGVGRGA